MGSTPRIAIDAMGGDARAHPVGRVEPCAGERAIGSDLARQTRQKPGRAHVGKKTDADFGHGEAEAVACHPVRTVDRNADAAAHHDAIDQRHIGLAVMLDERIEPIFVAPVPERLVVASESMTHEPEARLRVEDDDGDAYAPAEELLTPPPNGCVTGTNSTFGNTSVVVTYTTPPTYTLNGFSQPINDPPGTTPSVFKGGSTVPVKFSLSDPSTGQRISDATASAIASACQATFSPTLAGGSAGTVDETSSAATPTAGNCFRYDSTAHQFVFNWGTKGLPPGKYTLTATVTNPDSSVAAAHSISGVGLR